MSCLAFGSVFNKKKRVVDDGTETETPSPKQKKTKKKNGGGSITSKDSSSNSNSNNSPTTGSNRSAKKDPQFTSPAGLIPAEDDDDHDPALQRAETDSAQAPQAPSPPAGNGWSLRDFEPLRGLGEGSYGLVAEYRHKASGRVVAIKKVDIRREGDAKRLEFEQQTWQCAAGCRHPHIAPLYGVFMSRNNTRLFLVSQVCKTDLRKWAARLPTKCFHVDHVRAIMMQLLSAVEHLHLCSIIHRDIKPANILVDNEGFVRLTDFGLARHVKLVPGAQTARMTKALGTPYYRAPEVDTGLYGTAADIYSCGVVMYTLLYGEQPFRLADPSSLEELLERKNHPEHIDFGPESTGPPSEARDLIRRMLQPNALLRPIIPKLREHPFFTSGPAQGLTKEKIVELMANRSVEEAQANSEEVVMMRSITETMPPTTDAALSTATTQTTNKEEPQTPSKKEKATAQAPAPAVTRNEQDDLEDIFGFSCCVKGTFEK